MEKHEGKLHYVENPQQMVNTVEKLKTQWKNASKRMEEEIDTKHEVLPEKRKNRFEVESNENYHSIVLTRRPRPITGVNEDEA